MTVFILVPGVFTGPRIWRDTAARLTEAGAHAHPVALTGLSGDRTPVPSGVSLETHIEDVVAALDTVWSAFGQKIVLVGHDYGIHPAVGAADRRPDRISRIVHLDAGLPRDGVPALAAVPDGTVRAEVAARAGSEGPDGELPPPEGEGWARWGSVQGLSAAALDTLAALAAPQPLGTLIQPLRLTGAAAALPTTGVLCTGNGTGIEMVQRLVDFGDPALQVLARPEVTFFELATGHWPMLSRPGELAEVLLEAAAGEGHRLQPAGAGQLPPHLRPFLLDVPERPRERHGAVDLHLPDGDGPHPAVVFVHGGPLSADARPTPRDWPALRGYAQYAASEGVMGAVLDHRLHDLSAYPLAAADVAAAVELVRKDPRVDADRIALWFFSGGGLLSADWIAAPPPWLRCLAATYPVLAPLPGWGLNDGRFRPVAALADAGDLPPFVLTRVGRESPEIAATVERFLAAAEGREPGVEIIDVPDAPHAFETLDHSQEAREAVRRAMRTVLTHLRRRA